MTTDWKRSIGEKNVQLVTLTGSGRVYRKHKCDARRTPSGRGVPAADDDDDEPACDGAASVGLAAGGGAEQLEHPGRAAVRLPGPHPDSPDARAGHGFHTLYTFGYGGRQASVDDLLHIMVQQCGATVLDIRLSPTSQLQQWRRESLEAALSSAAYSWCQDLGNVNFGQRKNGLEIRIKDMDGGLATLTSRLAMQPVVILCGCADLRHCHRRTVADEARRRLGVEVVHLQPPLPLLLLAPVQYLQQPQRPAQPPGHSPGQPPGQPPR